MDQPDAPDQTDSPEQTDVPAAEAVDALIRFISRAERLESFPRSGWIACGVSEPESVAAHIHGVALIALWIADHHGGPVDVERVLRIALLHDVGEAMTTDLPWPVKRFVGADAIEAAETRATEAVLADAPASWRAAPASYRDQDCLEARIVKAADKIQMLAKALQYRSQRRGDVSRFWKVERNFKDYGIPLVRAVIDRLRQMWADDEWFDNGFD